MKTDIYVQKATGRIYLCTVDHDLVTTMPKDSEMLDLDCFKDVGIKTFADLHIKSIAQGIAFNEAFCRFIDQQGLPGVETQARIHSQFPEIMEKFLYIKRDEIASQ